MAVHFTMLVFTVLLLFITRSISVDPEVHMKAGEIISRWGYPYEEYNVTTLDGYILTIFRIPQGRQNESSVLPSSRPVVLFQHGLMADCVQWISNLPNQSAPFIFADQGFDVWLGNFRGNRYAKKHLNMTSKQPEFWQFSWDQMASHDLPAMINFILNTTQSPSLYYIGHSMGTLTAFAAFSSNQELGEKIRKFYALAPVMTVRHIKGAFRSAANYMWALQSVVKSFSPDRFRMPNWLKRQLAGMCYGIRLNEVCSNFLFAMAGPSSQQMNRTRLPVYTAHTPAATSTNTILHFGQMVHSGLFAKFQNGPAGRTIWRSGVEKNSPELYDISNMKTAVELYWGGNDWLSTQEDIEDMIPRLSNWVGGRFLPHFNHADFMWGLRAASEVYDPIAWDIGKDFERTVKMG